MPLLPEDIQLPRSPNQLNAFIESVRTSADIDDGERYLGHLRKGYYKEFFDEVIPLAKFAISVYSESHTVQPILGNQRYDAEVRDENGKLIDLIEIANPIDGKLVAETGRELVQSGVGGLRVGDPGEDVEELIPIIYHTARKKALKDYSDVTVVFNVSGLPPFNGFKEHHEAQMERVRQVLSNAGFKAKRVFVMLPSGMVERIEA